MTRPAPEAGLLRVSQLELGPRAFRAHAERLVRFFGPDLRGVMRAAERFRTARATLLTWLERHERGARSAPAVHVSEQPEVALVLASRRLREALRALGNRNATLRSVMVEWERDLQAELDRLAGRLRAVRRPQTSAHGERARPTRIPPRPTDGGRSPASGQPRARSWKPGQEPVPSTERPSPRTWRPATEHGSRRPAGCTARPGGGDRGEPDPRVTTLTKATGGHPRNTREALALMGLTQPGLDTVRLRTRYRALTRVYHPDRGGSALKMAAINAAYARLRDKRVRLRSRRRS